MRATLSDTGALASLDPTNLATYLRTKKWRRVQQEGTRYSLWATQISGEGFELLLPVDKGFRDYALRISEVLQALSLAENRSQLDVYADVQRVNFDVFRFRAASGQPGHGTIRVNQGVELVQAAREMLLAAACSAVTPKAYYSGRKPEEANSFIGEALLGQTEIGSYVVTTQIQVPPLLQGELFPGTTDDPFQRKAGRTLVAALEATKQAAIESAATGSIEPFTEGIRLGISSNLCAAIVRAQENAGGGDLEVSARWAPSHPVPNIAEQEAKVSFSIDLVQPVRTASVALREREPEESARIFGYVTLLEQEKQEKIYGEIVVTGPSPEGKGLRRVRVRLEAPDYKRALEAHAGKLLVTVTGDLVKHGNYFLLERPREFSVITDSRDGEI